jgi:predicted nucleic acid-binding protein
MRRGIELKRRRDPPTAQVYEHWLREVAMIYRNRILEVTDDIADTWGRLAAKVNLPAIDGLLAATAVHHGLTVATRNTADFQRCGVDYVNPFEA